MNIIDAPTMYGGTKHAYMIFVRYNVLFFIIFIIVICCMLHIVWEFYSPDIRRSYNVTHIAMKMKKKKNEEWMNNIHYSTLLGGLNAKWEMGKLLMLERKFTFSAIVMVPFWFPMHAYYYLRIRTTKPSQCCHVKEERMKEKNYVSTGQFSTQS